MNSHHFSLSVALLVATPCMAQWKYPATKTVDATDTYFGKTYKDPYRWLEDLKNKQVEAWFKANAELTDETLAKIPGREALAQQWLELDKLKPATYRSIQFVNGRVFYKKTLGSENVGKLYYREGWTGAEKLLVDPATYKAGVTSTIQDFIPSWDGKHVVLGFSAGGAEFSELRVLDVATRTLLPETFYPSYGPLSWTSDNRSFLYDASNVTDIKSLGIELNRQTRLHTLGTPLATDRDVFSDVVDPNLGIAPKEFPQAFIDESYPAYIIGGVYTVQQEQRLFYAPAAELRKKKITWNVLAQTSDKLVRGIAFFGDDVYAVTYADAPRYKLIRTSVKHPTWNKAETILPEAADSIQGIAKSKSFIWVVYSNGINGRLVRVDPATKQASDMKLPVSGSIAVECPDFRTDRCLVRITSWVLPMTLYDLDGVKGKFTKSIFNTDVTYPGFENLVSEEVEVPGHDGTLVPLSIIHRKDLVLDGKTSAILQGYGAYGYSITPNFDVRDSVALHGVVVAYCHPRGGGEKGEDWYKAGYKTTKPNTWKDYIACAEYLIHKGYTSAAKLGGTGTSAGGILITRAITERPDLFAAAICNVGCANAMRMEFSPNGPVNTPEFGTVTNEAEAQALFEMDGVQHVEKGVKYPGVLGVAGWNDPRVAPWEPGKFVAAMQAASTSGKPVLLKVNYDDGHFTEEKVVTFKNFAGQYAFLLWQSGHPDFQPAAKPTPPGGSPP
ncbi:MAG: prolyl oligopeptidase family serine peptidase [Myxococcaceae bacterium]